MSEVHLGLVILAVDDLDQALRFYRTAFAWPLTVDTPVYVEFQLPAGMRLGLYQREAFKRNFDRPDSDAAIDSVTGTELYFYADNPDAAMRTLAVAGADALSTFKARDWGDNAAYFADSEGNVIVIAQPVDDAASSD